MDIERRVKGAHVVAVITGGGDSLMGFCGDVESVAYRLHQAISDRLKCHPMPAHKKEIGKRPQRKKQ